MPVRNSNSALPRCDGLPTYDEPYDTVSGFAFAAAISAGTVWYGPFAATDEKERRAIEHRDRHEILLRIVGQLLVQRRIDRDVRVAHDEQLVAVGRRVLHRLDRDEAARARRRHRRSPAVPTPSTSLSAMTRVNTAGAAPAEYGAMMRTGREG